MTRLKRKFPVLVLGLYAIAIIAMTGFLVLPYLNVSNWADAETAAGFSITGVTKTVGPGYTNELVFSLDLPNPAADTLLLDGSSYAVAAGNQLTAFAANDKYSDSDHDDGDDYSGAELIVNSADATITAGEIITPGTAGLLAN